MNDVRTIHGLAALLNGVALFGALYAPRLGIACCVASALLLIWSAEKLRFHLVTSPRPRGERA